MNSTSSTKLSENDVPKHSAKNKSSFYTVTNDLESSNSNPNNKNHKSVWYGAIPSMLKKTVDPNGDKGTYSISVSLDKWLSIFRAFSNQNSEFSKLKFL